MTKTVAIVTGGSRGIGHATAMRLAKDFSVLVLVARNRTKLEDTAAVVRSAGAEALVIDADLAEPTAAANVVERTLSAFGRIDALLKVAGAVPGVDLLEMTDEQWASGMEGKFHGARRLTIQAGDALKASQGAIVFASRHQRSSAMVGAFGMDLPRDTRCRRLLSTEAV
ncbi:SDR family NAD(P)-dependent oxidoreductase [Methylobacterium oryzisoli]|uniref:SDR family NAD(P)-dependent oxidoreductase n=1 Tax=Methylobacterium oryzisoli TaxID=3385502 RepID=UPI003891A886